MRKSAVISNDDRKIRRNIWLLYICVYLFAAVVFGLSVHLCGKSFVQIYDAQEQYLPFLKYLNRYYRELIHNFLHGDFHLKMFDYSLGFGMDPIQVLSYYGIADPLSFPVIFFKQTQVLTYYYFLVFFRPFLAGAAFIGMCFHFKKVKYTVPFCGMLYLCTGWALYSSSFHPFFFNFMILLPLIIMGIDRILYRESPSLFICTVFLGGCIGFYFLFMISVCMFVFALVRLIVRRKEILSLRGDSWQDDAPDKSPGFRKREGTGSKSALFAAMRIVAVSFGYYVIGLAMSLFILLPAMIGVMGSVRGSSSILPEQLLFYPFKTLETLCSRAVFIQPGFNCIGISAVGLFVLTAVLTRRRSKDIVVLTCVAIVLWILPAWSTFLAGIALPNHRWFFALGLLFAFLCTDLVEYAGKSSVMQRVLFVGVVTAAIAVCDYPSGRQYTVILVLTVLSGILLLLVSGKRCGQAVRRFACTALICFQCALNIAVCFSPVWFGMVNMYSGKNVQEGIDYAPVGKVKNVPDYDDRYRTETGFSTTFNIPAVLRIPSIRVYASIIPASLSEFVMETENNTMTTPFSIYSLDGRSALMELCSVGYYLSSSNDGREIPFGYDKIFEDEEVSTYFNRYALSPEYVYYRTFDYEDLESKNGIEKQALMMTGATVDNSGLSPVNADSVNTGVKELSFEVTEQHGVRLERGSLVFDKDIEDPWMDITVKVPGDSEIYFRLKGFDSDERTLFTITGEDGKNASLIGRKRSWAYGQTNFSVLIEQTKNEGREAKYRLTFSENLDFALEGMEFYSYDLTRFEESALELSENSVQDVSFGRNCVNSSVDMKEDGILCLSVPYSRGWSVYVDGERKECVKANYLCTAVEIPEGHHEVTFRYRTPGLRTGILLSILGFAVFCLISVTRGRALCHTAVLKRQPASLAAHVENKKRRKDLSHEKNPDRGR